MRGAVSSLLRSLAFAGLAVALGALGSSIRAQTPVTASAAPTVVEIAASLHVLARLSDGTVIGLGENRSGQLARPPLINRWLRPERIPLPARAVQIAAGEDVSLARLEDGTVWAWGRGVDGMLGVNLAGATARHTPAPVPGLSGVVSLAAATTSAMAVLEDGTVRAWGDLPKVLTGGQKVNPAVFAPIPVRGLRNVATVVTTAGVGFALTKDGRVFGWGVNTLGQVGLGRTSDEPVPPTELPGLRDIVSIARTGGGAAAVARDGRVWVWGDNQQGGLGNGVTADTNEPGQPTPQPLEGVTDAVQVKAGTYGRHFIVLRRNGALVGWGNSDWGQLGAGISGFPQPTPMVIKLPPVDDYWLGGNFSFARTKDGELWFWGEQSAARRLVGATGNQKVPARILLDRLLPPAAPITP